jgi:outer membrane protein assembly factor BamB
MKKLAMFFLGTATVILSFSSWAETTEIKLTSGEHLTGEILSIAEGEMVLSCPWGKASIELDALEEIYFTPQKEKIFARGLLLKDGTNLLGAELSEKKKDKFVFSLPYGKLILTDPLELSYLNPKDSGELVLPDNLKAKSTQIVLQSRGDFPREKIVGELVRYEKESFRIKSDYGLLEVPEAEVRGISFTGKAPSLGKPGLKIWQNLPLQGKPASFTEGAWKIEAPFGVFLVERYGLIREIIYPASQLSAPEEEMVLVTLQDGTELWGNILAWEDKQVTFSLKYGTLSLSSLEILKISSLSMALSPNIPPNILSLTAQPETLKPEEVSLVTCQAQDPDGEALSYEWSVSQGSIEGEGTQVKYKAPSSSGNYSLEVTLTDERGAKVRGSLTIMVQPANRPPEIISLAAYARTLEAGKTTLVTCEAEDPDGDRLSYEWSVSAGSIEGSGSQVRYKGPSSPGNHLLEVMVTDQKGLKVKNRIWVIVTEPKDHWPMFGYDLGRSGTTPSGGPKGEVALLWRYRTGDDIFSSPAVAEGIVYVGSYDDSLYVFDAKSGKLLWKYETENDISSSPAVAEGIVYVGSADNHLYALDAKSGKLLWKYETENDISSSPAVAEGIVYVGSYDDSLYVFDAKSGKLLWKYETESDIRSSPAVAERIVYVGSADNHLYALDAKSGKLLWKYETGDDVFSSPAVAEGTVYVGSADNHLYALDAKSGKLLWKYRTRHDVFSSPAVAKGIVYVGSYDNRAYAIGRRITRRK